jgi:hypothetical protein
MATISRSTKAARDKLEKQIRLKQKFETRITMAKRGKIALDAGDYTTALRCFTDYLSIMAEIKEVKEYTELKLNMFDPKKDLTETFMISQILFEMARLYDAVPKFQPAAQKCLDLFVHFTANQPYQVVNSELVRKSLKRSTYKSPDMFREAYRQIFVQSKKCYIVSFCYGDEHIVTKDCRKLKDRLIRYDWGQTLVRMYYQFSSQAVPKCENNFILRSITRILVKPILFLFSKTFLPVIIKK